MVLANIGPTLFERRKRMRKGSLVVIVMVTALLLFGNIGVVQAGIAPSPFQPPGKVHDAWVPPGQIVGFDPQPEPPGFTPKMQILEPGFGGPGPDVQPPGEVRDAWVPPGQIVGFDPQPEPPGFTPIIQANQVLL